MSAHSRSHFGVLVGFVVISIIVTWPLAMQLTEGIPYGGDAWQFIWNGWWFGKAVLDPDLSLWFTNYVYAPEGGSLALHDFSPLNSFFIACLTPTIGDFASINLLLLIHYVLGAWGACILAWYLTGNRAGSVIAGVIYGFSTWHAMHLTQLGIVSSGWVPLAVYYLLKFARDGGWRDELMSLVMLLACGLTHWYNLAFVGLVFFGFMLIGSFSLKEYMPIEKGWFRAIRPWAFCLLILAPIILKAIDQLNSMDLAVRLQLGQFYFMDPAWLVLPSPDHPLFGGFSRQFSNAIPANLTEGVATLGFAVIILGFLTWFRKNPLTRALCWVSLILLLLSLGSSITVFGYETHVPGPFALWSKIPWLNMIRIPARFIGPFTLTLGLAVAGWIAGLNPDWRSGLKRIFLLWIIPAVIIFETLVIPIPITGKEFHHLAFEQLDRIYDEAANTDGSLDLIINVPQLPPRSEYMFLQTIHEIPMVDGALSVPPSGKMEFLAVFNFERTNVRDLGIDLIFLHKWATGDSSFHIPEDSSGVAAGWAGQDVPPAVFFKEIMGYKALYEDDDLLILAP